MGIEKIIPSMRSRTPPCPGNKLLVFFTFALRFKYEMNKSPICEDKDITMVIKIINNKLISGMLLI